MLAEERPVRKGLCPVAQIYRKAAGSNPALSTNQSQPLLSRSKFPSHVPETIFSSPTLKNLILTSTPSPLSRSILTRERSSFERKMLVFRSEEHTSELQSPCN